MTIRDWKLITALAVSVGLTAVMTVCAPRVAQAAKPKLIMEEGTEPIMDQYGDALVYRYFVDGTESFTVVRDAAQLREFKAYLRQVGILIEKSEK